MRIIDPNEKMRVLEKLEKFLPLEEYFDHLLLTTDDFLEKYEHLGVWVHPFFRSPI